MFERSVKQRLQEAAAAGRWLLFWMTQPESIPRALLEHLLFNASRWLAELGGGDAAVDGSSTSNSSRQQPQQQGAAAAAQSTGRAAAAAAEHASSSNARTAGSNLQGEDTEDTLVGDSSTEALSSSRALRFFLLMQLDPPLMPSCEFFQDSTRIVVDTSMVLHCTLIAAPRSIAFGLCL